MSFSSVTVNVCGWPTSFVAFGAIEIRALTHVLTAGPEFAAGAVRVPRQRDAADRQRRVRADTVVTPVTAEVSVIVQLPVPPTVVHGFGGS